MQQRFRNRTTPHKFYQVDGYVHRLMEVASAYLPVQITPDIFVHVQCKTVCTGW